MKIFTFEHEVVVKVCFSEVFEQSWVDISLNLCLSIRLAKCSCFLNIWAGDRFNRLGSRLKNLREDLDYLWKISHVKDILIKFCRLNNRWINCRTKKKSLKTKIDS